MIVESSTIFYCKSPVSMGRLRPCLHGEKAAHEIRRAFICASNEPRESSRGMKIK